MPRLERGPWSAIGWRRTRAIWSGRCSKPSKANFRNGPGASPRCFPRSKTGWRAPCATNLPRFRSGNAGSFLTPLRKVRKQAFRALQQFRDRLSDRTMRAFGVPLRTTETEINVVEPSTPDIRVGRVFDRNWELLSPLLPVWMIKAAVHRHFARTICIFGLSEPQPAQHAVGREHQWRAVGCREGGPAAAG